MKIWPRWGLNPSGTQTYIKNYNFLFPGCYAVPLLYTYYMYISTFLILPICIFGHHFREGSISLQLHYNVCKLNSPFTIPNSNGLRQFHANHVLLLDNSVSISASNHPSTWRKPAMNYCRVMFLVAILMKNKISQGLYTTCRLLCSVHSYKTKHC